METQTIINAGLGLIAFMGGWIVRNLQEIEILVAGTYVKREDMDKLGTALFAKLDRIENKVDQKLNRDECPGCKP
jgi:hypothetical protein